MRVRCIANTGSDLSEKSLDAGFSASSQFSIDIGGIYIVYAVNLWNGVISYLVDLSGNPPKWLSMPRWNPAELFEIVDNRIPPNWCFDFRGYRKDYPLNAICGYPELLDEDHYDNLLEGEEEAMFVFLKRKKEVDEFYEPNDDG